MRASYNRLFTLVLASLLIAELQSGLVMAFRGMINPALLVTATATQKPIRTVMSTSTARPSSTPTLTVTPTFTISNQDNVPGLGPAQCYNLSLVSADFGASTVVNQLQQGIPNSYLTQAGLVLIWAHGANLNEGVRIASRIGQILDQEFPESFSRAVKKSLYFNMGIRYHVQLEVYFFANTPWSSGLEVPCEYNL